MKRDFLKGLGLADDSIEVIMAENGRDVASLQSQVSTLQQQLSEANQTVEKTKNYDEIVQQLKEAQANNEKLTNDVKEAETKAKADLVAVKKENAIKLAVSKSSPIDEVAYMAHLNQEKIVFNDETGELTGFKEQDDEIRKNQAYLFEPVSNGNQHGGINSNNQAPVSMLEAVSEHYK